MILNKIYIEDVFTFLDKLEDKSVDLAIIDPPYNLKIASWDSFKNDEEFLTFSYAWIDKTRLIKRYLKSKKQGVLYF